MEPIIENEFAVAKKLFSKRMIMKQMTQLSFEIRKLEERFPSDYYEFNNAEEMNSLYQLMEDKVLQLAEEIKAGRQ